MMLFCFFVVVLCVLGVELGFGCRIEFGYCVVGEVLLGFCEWFVVNWDRDDIGVIVVVECGVFVFVYVGVLKWVMIGCLCLGMVCWIVCIWYVVGRERFFMC